MAERLAGPEWSIRPDCQDTDNFNNYMTKIGVGLLTRTAVKVLKPTVTITITDQEWKIETKSSFKNFTVIFTLDKEIEETTGDGREVTAFYKVEGNKLIKTEKSRKSEKDPVSIMTREFIDDMNMTLTLVAIERSAFDAGDADKVLAKCERKYKRDPPPAS